MAAFVAGIDLIDVRRIAAVLARHGDRFLERVYTPRERDYCGHRLNEFAARFAGKEATMKALGTGLRGIAWKEIEILGNARGKPVLLLHGRARARAARLGIAAFDISLTHEGDLAAAMVVGGPAPETQA